MSNDAMQRLAQSPTYWRNGADLTRPMWYGEIYCRTLGEVLLAIVQDPEYPTAVDVVDQ